MAWMLRKKQQVPWTAVTPASGIGGRVAVRRTETLVEMMIDSVTVPADGNVTIVQIPAGYVPAPTPQGMNQRNGLIATVGGSVRLASVLSGGMRILGAQASQAYSGHLTWTTDDAMPGGS